ncbi:MAG: pilus assembly PilX N-terminal domain-containing protein [Pseudomonadota bacterium]
MRTRHLKGLWHDRYRFIHAPSLLANEDGSVIILALIMLVLLTLVGTSSTNTSIMEVQMAGNERVYKQNFFMAEATAMQTFQWIEDLGNPTSNTNIKDSTFKWVDGGANTTFNNVTANWVNLSTDTGKPGYDNLYSLVVHTGVAAGGSLDVTASTSIHAYSVYGQYVANADTDTSDNERLIIESGYKKRF